MRREELEKLILDEIRQREEEGYDVSEVRVSLAELRREDASRLEMMMDRLSRLKMKPGCPYKEPSDLAGIRKERPEGPRRMPLGIPEEELRRKILGGWLGRCAGCLLGKPSEGLSKDQIEYWLKAAGAYPLDDYFPPIPDLPVDAPEWLRSRLSQRGVLRGQIKRMARDDDIDYTIINLHILETWGFEFTAQNVGEAWLTTLPYLKVYTAERAAYRNLVNGLVPPETATYMNPYREWIGAQIRGDMWGYVAPGMPEYGAELAFRDARLSHVKNGIYGEMFVSAMISAAFATDEIEEIIKVGLSEIPAGSRLSEAIRDVMEWRREYSDWRDAWERINEKYGHYHPVHTINNAALVVLGLLYGEGDFGRSIAISVMGGWDTDCNGATVGSVLGVVLGADNLPERWIAPLNDRVNSFVAGYDNSRISDLAERTFNLAKTSLEKE